ncbi:hypothetical protein ACFU6K_25675 [Kitasatospora sp. NPDC057512]
MDTREAPAVHHLTGGDRRIALNVGLVTTAAVTVRLAAGLW